MYGKLNFLVYVFCIVCTNLLTIYLSVNDCLSGLAVYLLCTNEGKVIERQQQSPGIILESKNTLIPTETTPLLHRRVKGYIKS